MTEEQMNGEKAAKIFDNFTKLVATVSVAFCGFAFVRIMELEARTSAHDQWISSNERFYSEHQVAHAQLNKNLHELQAFIAALNTDVKVIEGNRFTSKDGQDLMAEMTRVWQSISDLRDDVKNIQLLLK
jgi:hypothetical protein